MAYAEPMTPPAGQVGVIARLGTTQTLAWASSYYLPALLAVPLASDLGMPVARVFGAFTLALLIAAAVGPWAGRAIDQFGGRSVLRVTNVLFALGLAALGWLQTEWQLWTAWGVLGLAMGSGLYDAAFATLVRLYPLNARRAITGITLVAGFASTVGWPLTAWWLEALGWRGACWVWAGLHLLVGLPLHAGLPRSAVEAPSEPAVQRHDVPLPAGHLVPRWMAMAMATVFAITWFISTAMAAHLPGLLAALGLSATAALTVAMLVGPAQVLGRLLEYGALRNVHPLLSARLAALAHPLGAVGLILLGPAFGAWFAGLHGAGNGILTIAKGTLPLVVFGAAGYGARQGWLMVPARITQAVAPMLFGLAIVHGPKAALLLTASLSLLVLLVLHVMAKTLKNNV